MRDKLTELYEGVINEAVGSMAVKGATQPGELEGPTQGVKGDGPDKAGVDSPEDPGKKLSPRSAKQKSAKPDKKVSKVQKESKMQDKKSFMELYDEIVVEADIESDEYNDDMGDFPAPGGEDMEDAAMADGEGEESKAELFSQLSEIYAKLSEMEGGVGDEMDVPAAADDMEFADEEGTMGEAVSEPEPKEFNPPISKLQAPRKLGGPGVKTKKGKGNGAIKGKRDGSLETAPSGTPVGGSNKVGGSGPAASGSGSMLES